MCFNNFCIFFIIAVKPGWGDWAGSGLSGVSERTVKNRKRQLENLEEENAKKRVGRKDGQVFNVMISDRRVKASGKYKLVAVPHPFTSREEYERSIQMPLGEEWNASHIVRRNTKPEVMLRAGRVIAPIKLSKDKTSANVNKSNRRGLQ
jgi:U3 small nucleolar RNA-associated protein 14